VTHPVWFLVPEGVDDPTRPSGGNVYDVRVREALRRLGWAVVQVECRGAWPGPAQADIEAVAEQLAEIPDDGVVLVDGLVGSAGWAALVAEADRIRLVPLLHMPLGSRGEHRLLAVSRAVLTVSHSTRQRLLEHSGLRTDRVHVAEPGVDMADPVAGTEAGAELLCVAAVLRAKGHDVLVDALATLGDLDWRLTLVGALDRDAEFVAALRGRIETSGLTDRIRFPGTCSREEVDKAYAEADLLVLASRSETYGMVVTEALAHGLPVVAGSVGGLAEALGCAPDGSTPGLLVPVEDPAALAVALRRWLTDPLCRSRLRRAAGLRRMTLTSWSGTASRISAVLDEVVR
jgi:glycosyltransferase involved in cell wall biosynthesis